MTIAAAPVAPARADVIIVGAGLVGSALACALADAELEVVLLDNQADVPVYRGDSFDPKVVALSAGAVAFLERLDAWSAICAERLCPYLGMEVWDGEGSGRITFAADDLHCDNLGYIVENSVALTALRRRVAGSPAAGRRGAGRVTFLAPVAVQVWQSLVDVNRVTLTDGTQLEAPLLIGADGAHSQLRELAQIPVRQWDYHHEAIVTTIRTTRPHGQVARQRFSHQGPLALLPLRRDAADPGHYCSIVWSLERDAAQAAMALDTAEFCRALTATSEGCLGQVTDADVRFSIPLWQRHARTYGRPGFALVGDAAHTIHPLAGQGVNLGLYDARVLAEEILRARRRGVSLGHESVVQRYQRQRKLHNLGAMATMEGFKRLFGSQSPAVLTLRNRGLDWVDGQFWLKRLLMQTAAGDA